MGSTPDWNQLAYDVAHQACELILILAFLLALSYLAGKTSKECASFLRLAAKAEFTQLSGLIDLALFAIFCIFVYTHGLAELVFAAAGLGQLSTDPHLWNPDARLLATVVCFLASLIFVGLLLLRKERQSKPN